MLRGNPDPYFTLPTTQAILESNPVYEAEEYEQSFPLIANTMPSIFSINLKAEIEELMTCLPPAFKITVYEVIDVACYYYADWDSPKVATDDFIDHQVVHTLRDALSVLGLPPNIIETELSRQIEILSDALVKFMGVIINVLSRCNCPAVPDFGSVYKLDRIDDIGDVYFGLRSPEIVYDTIEENIEAVQRATQLHLEDQLQRDLANNPPQLELVIG